MRKWIVGLLFTLTLVTPAYSEIIIDAASPTQKSGTAKITAYKYNPDGTVNTDVKVHYKVVSTNNGKVFDSYLLEPYYGVGFIWIIDPKFNADFLLYASNGEAVEVSIYVEYFNGDGQGLTHSIFTEARTLRPGQRAVWSSARYVCPQNNPYATNTGAC